MKGLLVFGLSAQALLLFAACMVKLFIELEPMQTDAVVLGSLGWLCLAGAYVVRHAEEARPAKRVDVTTFGDTERKYKTTL
jgi:hypothetical protein